MSGSRWRPVVSAVLTALLCCEQPAVWASDGASDSYGPSSTSDSEDTESGTNVANNPFQPSLLASFEDYYVPTAFGIPGKTENVSLFRGLIPLLAFDQAQLLRFTVPVETAPQFPNGNTTGVGDLEVFDLLVFGSRDKRFLWGIGPAFTAPTANNPALGSGKWQVGLSAGAATIGSWGLAGVLVISQDSIGGTRSRTAVGSTTVQPAVFYNLPQGFYLRSSAIWNFDMHGDGYFVPIGAGIGRVWKVRPKLQVNAFCEPQLTVLHKGLAPQWQMYAGVNIQYLLTPPGK